jgi:RimJ/RimL family protein N-acetyltransferase
VPRRLTRPDPPLADDAIRLEPLAAAHAADFVELIQDDDVKRFTFVPSDAGGEFLRTWLARYEEGWNDGARAGFCMRDLADDAFLGFAAIVRLDLEGSEGEIGYMVAPAARGRGTAVRAVELLTRWAFDELSLERLQLRIDVANLASERVAERAGYRREGVLRNAHFKDGLRSDTGVWSRLPTDPRVVR